MARKLPKTERTTELSVFRCGVYHFLTINIRNLPREYKDAFF